MEEFLTVPESVQAFQYAFQQEKLKGVLGDFLVGSILHRPEKDVFNTKIGFRYLKATSWIVKYQDGTVGLFSDSAFKKKFRRPV